MCPYPKTHNRQTQNHLEEHPSTHSTCTQNRHIKKVSAVIVKGDMTRRKCNCTVSVTVIWKAKCGRRVKTERHRERLEACIWGGCQDSRGSGKGTEWRQMRGGSKSRRTGWGGEMPVQFRISGNGLICYLQVTRHSPYFKLHARYSRQCCAQQQLYISYSCHCKYITVEHTVNYDVLKRWKGLWNDAWI